MKYSSSAIPGKAEKSPTKKMPYPKTTGATSGKSLPPCTAGLGKTRKTSAKGMRHK